MDLRKLGALLREERERRGLSLDDVSNKIKISRSCLAAIEDGNEDCLPHPVYAKGFIRNYARLLGLDNEEFLDELSRIFQPEETPLQTVPLIEDIPDEEGEGRGSSLLGSDRVKYAAMAVAGLVLLVGLGWFVYAMFLSGPSSQPSATPPVPAVTEKPRPVPTSPTPAAEPAAPAPVAEAPVPPKAATPAPVTEPPAPPVATTPAPAPEPVATPPAVAPEAKPAATAKGPEPTPEDRATQDIALSGSPAQPPATPASPAGKHFAVGDRGNHEVTMTASDRCWIQAGADGGTMRETMLEAGDTFSGRFNDYLLVRLGNAGAVEIHFDGKLYPLKAGKGSVKTLKFLGRKADEAAAQAAPATPAAPDAPAAPDKSPVPDKPAKAEKPAASSGETPAAPKELEVYGQDGSWVILIPDNGPSKEVYVKKGQRMTVPFNDKIEVRLGNPSNVIFRYDGKETPVTTERGGTKTVRFP